MKNMKKLFCLLLVSVILLSLAACGRKNEAALPVLDEAETRTSFRIGVCGVEGGMYLDRIVSHFVAGLEDFDAGSDFSFDFDVRTCGADAAEIREIIGEFIDGGVDLMVGVTEPVALAMQAATRDSGIPVIFAAVPDPVGAGLAVSRETPGANVTGVTEDIDVTGTTLNLIFAAQPEADEIALLYDPGLASSAAAAARAKDILDGRGIAWKEYTGSGTEELLAAAKAVSDAGADAVFTPDDDTVLAAETEIAGIFSAAGIPQYGCSQAFAEKGAFAGFGADGGSIGMEAGRLVIELLIIGSDPASTAFSSVDETITAVNTDTCEALGFEFEEIASKFAPWCTEVESVTAGPG